MRSLLPNPKHTTPPERPRAVPQQRPSRPVGIGGTVIAELIAADAPVSLRYPAPVRLRPEALLTASAATVHTLAVAYDDLADEVETALAELAALIPLAVAL